MRTWDNTGGRKMAKRNDIHKVLIIGSGPIIIGQACEFDYSGTQACKALRNLGYEIVLVNSNPATIMTDPEIADVTYIEPLNVDRIEQIIKKERPDALLPNLGGQSGLNLCSELAQAGVLGKYNVEVIGVQVDAIERGEDRIEFKHTMDQLGIEMARSEVAYSVDEALAIAEKLGYPVVLRPAYTMGGAGGGLVYNVDELKTVCARGLQASLVGQVLVEESILGWEELELEVVRDAEGNMITVCFIENIDPLGVHTGDSFCSAPMLTISEEVQQRLQEKSHKVVDSVKVIGGCNVQWAHDPKTDRDIIIEINPRTSRSSALASKATGFPIALVSAMLATGMTLKDIPCGKYGTLDKYVPDGDYVVIKFARWAFEKFKGVEDKLGTQMRAVGEVMSIGKNFKEAFQKAIRSLETGRYGLGHAKDFDGKTKEELLKSLRYATSERYFVIYEALRKGASVEEIHELTKVKHYFLEQMKELVEEEEALLAFKGGLPEDNALIAAKKDGFSDKYLSQILEVDEDEIRNKRISLGVEETWEGVHVSGTQDRAYYYSTYNGTDKNPISEEKPKIMILGGGPNRIGQGIEFDYCCVHASLALKKLGFETIIVNCNPETVSTDYDMCDRLYFDELTFERVMDILELENPHGVIVSTGGQIPNNLALRLDAQNIHILGTSAQSIDNAEDREKFSAMLDRIGVDQPRWRELTSLEDINEFVDEVGFPVLVRPSYVLSGAAMNVCSNQEELERFLKLAANVSKKHPVVVSQFIEHAKEVEMDAVAQNGEIIAYAISEHIEFAGVHSGDATIQFPPQKLYVETVRRIKRISREIAKALNISGPFNIQYLAKDNDIKVIECNLRASRSFPFVSKVLKINFIELATKVMLGLPVEKPEKNLFELDYVGIKASQFSFNRLQKADPVLGVDMASTGEVGCIGSDTSCAVLKAMLSVGYRIPKKNILLSTGTMKQKADMMDAARMLVNKGYKLFATGGTHKTFAENGIESTLVYWPSEEGHPQALEMLHNKEIDMVVNIPKNLTAGELDNGYKIRRAAIDLNVPLITNARLASAFINAFCTMTVDDIAIKSWEEYK